MGKRQRALLAAIQKQLMVPLCGDFGLLAASRSLQRKGLLVIVRQWNANHSQVCHYAARPDAKTPDGKPIRTLSVARLTWGTRTTNAGSMLDRAAQQGVSES